MSFERDGKRVEVALEFGSGKGRQAEDLKQNRAVFADKTFDEGDDFFDNGWESVIGSIRGERYCCRSIHQLGHVVGNVIGHKTSMSVIFHRMKGAARTKTCFLRWKAMFFASKIKKNGFFIFLSLDIIIASGILTTIAMVIKNQQKR